MMNNNSYPQVRYRGEARAKRAKIRFSPPPMRGIKQALDEVRAADPDTALTERALRRMVISGVIPSVRVGSKYLINMNRLFDYLSGSQTPATAEESGGIRAVSE